MLLLTTPTARPSRLTRLPTGLLLLLLCAALALSPHGWRLWAQERPAATPPNVLLIVADDMRVDGLQVMPALEELARRGVSFDRAYVTTPTCCPSRSSILTGQYARHHGVLSNEQPDGGFHRLDDTSTLATWLQAASVRTGLIGKYLNDYRSTYIPPGWDHWFAFMQFHQDYGLYYRYNINDQGEDRSYGSSSENYSTRVVGRQSLRFLRQDRERPFMLLLAPRTPHGPATPDVHDKDAFRDTELPRSPSYDEADVGDKPSWIRELAPLRARAERDIDSFRRRQLESLLSLDRAIAAIVDELASDGRLDQTWIIFTSDNGLMLGEHRLSVQKEVAYEESVRVPLIVVPPGGLAAPRVEQRLVANIDLAPTIAAIMGVEPSIPQDGASLLPLLADPAAPWRDALVLENFSEAGPGSYQAIRTADRKYVRYGNGEEELYDDLGDPYELENLSADPAWAAEKLHLSERLDALVGR